MTSAEYRQRLAGYDAILSEWQLIRGETPELADDIADLETHRSKVAEWAARG